MYKLSEERGLENEEEEEKQNGSKNSTGRH